MKTYVKGRSTKTAKNFESTEFDCHGKACCSETLIDEKLVDYVQKIRDHFKKPVIVSSAYRCPVHNKAIGGATTSRHSQGKAADIYIAGVKPSEIAKYAESIGILGIGLYETDKDGFFVHVDTRTSRNFWYGQAEKYRDTFGGDPAKKAPDKGNAKVREWQKAAIADGFHFGCGTDGIWGPECVSVAKKAVCKKQLIGYKYKSLTKIIQAAVGVTVDGKFGNDTKKAVTAWQKRFGLVADGVVGINTWKKILGIK